MIRTLIIEDETAIVKEIKWFLSQEPDIEVVGCASRIPVALDLISELHPDLVLMDIQLTDGIAFDILNQLEDIDFQLIFLTAFNNFAIKAIKYGALDYLLKPIDEDELKVALDKARKKIGAKDVNQDTQLKIALKSHLLPETPDSHLVLHTMEFIQILQLKEIIYCKSEGSYTTFFLTDDRKLMISKPLKFYDELLPDQYFLRPHQSFLVNFAFIDKYLKSGSILLKNQTEIPVSIRRKEYVLQRLIKLN